MSATLVEQPDERVRFELEHVAHVSDELWAWFGPGAVGVGWDLAVLGLALHLAGDRSILRRPAPHGWCRSRVASSWR